MLSFTSFLPPFFRFVTGEEYSFLFLRISFEFFGYPGFFVWEDYCFDGNDLICTKGHV